MVNLLSPQTRARLTTKYYARFATVMLTALAFAFLVSAILMLPTYFFIHAEADQAQEYVQAANAIAAERAKGASQATLASFHESVTLLTASARDPSFARVMGLLTADIPRGVTLSRIAVIYDDTGNASVGLEGVARTRSELIAYTQTLKQVIEFSNVTVPVGDLVADVDSSFSVALTWVRPKAP